MRAIESGADAIGLNFYEKSLRNISAMDAMDISAAVSKAVATVGVFVNKPPQEITALAEHLRLSAVQLHGNEDPSIMDLLDEIDVIRAIRVRSTPPGAAGKNHAVEENDAKQEDAISERADDKLPDETSDELLDEVVRDVQLEIDKWVSAGAKGILLDAHSPAGFGGTGTAFNWKIASRLDIPGLFILAGGLDSKNVGDVILGVQPDAVDVASSIERFPGVKDPGKMVRFSSAAREAFHRL